jgi:disulfide oxidoreductase YuzD
VIIVTKTVINKIYFREDIKMEKVKIEVYGGINADGGGCSCGCTSCAPADAKAEYEAMKEVLLERFGEETLSLEYIDTGGVNLAEFPEVEKVVLAGYPFPITFVNGNPRWAGGITIDSITEIVTAELQPPK